MKTSTPTRTTPTRRAAMLAAVGLAACATSPEGTTPSPYKPASLIGTWDVSLNFDPTQPPSKTEMSITAIGERKIEGAFYGSPFIDGMITREDGEVVYKAYTRDQSSDYFHDWRVQDDGTLKGETLSPQRNFRMAWTAVKKP